MTKKDLRRYARLQLKKLNDVIDQKILAGKPYKTEAMVHARLVRSMA